MADMDARINIPAKVAQGEPFEVRIQIRHPMETGLSHRRHRQVDPAQRDSRVHVPLQRRARLRGADELRHRGQPVPALLRHRARRRASSIFDWIDDAGVRGRRARRRVRRLMRVIFLAAAFGLPAIACAQERRSRADLRSGIAFAGADVRAMQADDRANPAFLWVRARRSSGRRTARRATASASVDARRGGAVSLRTMRVRRPCSISTAASSNAAAARQQKPPFGRESEDLLALEAYVTHQSRGMPIDVVHRRPGACRLRRAARRSIAQRHGQMNLACTHCHDQNYGKRLYTETLARATATRSRPTASSGRRWARCAPHSRVPFRRARGDAERPARPSSPTSRSISPGARKGLPIEVTRRAAMRS